MGGNPSNVGVKGKPVYVAPRIGAAYRIDDNTVFRTGYGITVNPLPWSRPLRGFYPATIAFSQAAAGNNFIGSLEQGIPPIAIPDLSTRQRAAAAWRGHAHAESRPRRSRPAAPVERHAGAPPAVRPGDERRLRRHADQRRVRRHQPVNYAEPGGGEAGRRFFAQAGSATILDWGNWTTSKYHSLQMAVNRPFKNGLLLKGAYTWSKAMNMADEDGWTGLELEHPEPVRSQLRAGRLRPAARAADGLRLRTAVDA